MTSSIHQHRRPPQTYSKVDLDDVGHRDKKEIPLNDITRALQRGYMELDDGWITPFNGYQYKVNFNEQNWEESRSVCQSWGGDLIVYGFQDHAARVTIERALRLTERRLAYWIGLNDKETEGNWIWVNGNRARTDDITLWRPSQPNSYRGNQDCGVGWFGDNTGDRFLAGDEDCLTGRRVSICETLI